MNRHPSLSPVPFGPYETFTASSNRLSFSNPGPENIDRASIAHHLAMLNRWTGNTHFAYSVAQHSLLVADLIRVPEWRIYGLLHDAAEAYTGDLPTPLKHWLQMDGADIMGLERRILVCIYDHFKLPSPTRAIAEAVDKADADALATEYRDVVKGSTPLWTPAGKPHSATIKFKTGLDIECQFLEALDTYLRLAEAW